MDQTKSCNSCNTTKPVGDFYFSSGKYEARCKICRKTAMDVKRAENEAKNQMIDRSGVKECGTCHSKKLKTEFAIRRSSLDGLASVCTDCNRDKSRQFYHSESGQLTHRVTAAKSRAEASGYGFDIDKQFIGELLVEQEGRCAVSGVLLDTSDTGTAKVRGRHTPSIDRIDSKKGYTRDNVRLVTQAVNIAKGVWEDKDLVEFSVDWLKHHGYTVVKGD